jgi:hypothetical protein
MPIKTSLEHPFLEFPFRAPQHSAIDAFEAFLGFQVSIIKAE